MREGDQWLNWGKVVVYSGALVSSFNWPKEWFSLNMAVKVIKIPEYLVALVWVVILPINTQSGQNKPNDFGNILLTRGFFGKRLMEKWDQRPNNHSTSNILWTFILFKIYFQKYESSILNSECELVNNQCIYLAHSYFDFPLVCVSEHHLRAEDKLADSLYKWEKWTQGNNAMGKELRFTFKVSQVVNH